MGYVGYKRTIQLDFNYDKVKQGVPKVNQQMALLNSEFNKVSAQANATGTAFDKLALNNQKLGSQVQLQKDKVFKLQQELEKLTTSETKNQKAMASKQIALNNAQAQLTRLQTAYANSNKELEKATTLTGKFKLAMEDMRLGAERAGVDLEKTFSQASKYFAALGITAAGSLKMFSSFEDSMIKSRTIMDESQVSYRKMQENVLDMSDAFGIASKEMAEANYAILSSNVATSDANSILYQSSVLAKTGFTDVATAADILTSIMNGYKISASEANKIVDQLIMTQKLGKLTIGDLSASLGDLIGISASAGVPLQQVEAAIATMTLSGVKADTAITNMRQILSALVAPTAEAKKSAEELGISFNASAIESKGFAKWLGECVKKTNGSTEAMASLFGNIRSLSGMLALTNDGGKKFNEVLNEITNSSGMANEALGMIEETTGQKMRESFSQLQNSAIKLGDAISPVIDMFAAFADFLSGIPTEAVIVIATLTTTAMVLKVLGVSLTALGASGIVAGGGMTALGAGMTTCVAPILIVAAAIGLVVGLIAMLANRSKEATKEMTNLATTSKNAASSVTNVANNVKKSSSRGYATGTNFVPEDGWYRVNEYGQQERFIRRGTEVRNGAQTRLDEKNNRVDMSETNSLLKTLCAEFKEMKKAYQEQPRQMQRLAREGGI